MASALDWSGAGRTQPEMNETLTQHLHQCPEKSLNRCFSHFVIFIQKPCSMAGWIEAAEALIGFNQTEVLWIWSV